MRAALMMVVVGLVAAVVGGCGGTDVEAAEDPALAEALARVAASGEPTPLSDVTDFEWDTVHVFGEATAASDITAAVGAPVIDGDFFTVEGDLLVFTLDGEVRRAVVVPFGPVTTDGTTSFSRDARLEPRDAGTLVDLVDS